MKINKASVIKTVLGGISGLIASLLLIITFVDSSFVPSWSDIFSSYIEIDETADIITVLDVGQGDCILIQSNSRFAVIDTGDGKSADVTRLLKRQGVNGLDALILSHWHSDHIGGAEEILENFPVSNAVFPESNSTEDEILEASDDLLFLCENKNVSVHTAASAMVINVGDFELTVLQADYTTFDENNRSLIIMAKCRDEKFLFTGDAEFSAENTLINNGINADCDILKVSHHGSDTATSEDFLDLCTPETAIVSVGAKNSYGHPTKEVLNRLYDADAEVY